MEATQMPPDSIARRIAASAARDSRFGSIASHTQACVSSGLELSCSNASHGHM